MTKKEQMHGHLLLKLRRAWTIATRLLVLIAILFAIPMRGIAAEPEIRVEADVVYGHKDGLAMTMDVFRPLSHANGAAVLFVVSGGWYSKWAPPEQMKGLLEPFLTAGYTAFAIRHGSSPRYSIPEAVADLRQAVRWIRHDAARFEIDPDRFGVFGMSAGGHLSLMLGTTGDDGDPEASSALDRTSNRVQAVVAFVPPTDLQVAVWEAPESLPAYRNFPALNLDLEHAREHSPLVHVSPDDAPSLVIMGGKDELVPPRHGRWIDKAFEQHGVTRKLIVYPESGHGLEGNQEKAFVEAVAWFNAQLTTPVDQPSSTKVTRSFRMGFTGFVYDYTLEAVMASRAFVRDNGDILAHHIEGVPWAESLRDEPYSAEFLEEWQGKREATPDEGLVYLAISPGRGELKKAEKGAPMPPELTGKDYADPLVQRTYLKYCRRAVDFFKPNYLAIGIETNEIHDLGPETWQAYVSLHRYVYYKLKESNPDLPIFATWTLHNMFKKQGAMLASWQKLMPYNDIIGVSYYPFFMDDADRLKALDWINVPFDEFGKPYAIVETNDAAERLPLPEAGVVIEGNPAKQAAYYAKLLSLVQDGDFEFVISFVHQDYDALWEKIKSFSPELFMAWRDCGLLDEEGTQRPAYTIWKDYFDRELEKN